MRHKTQVYNAIKCVTLKPYKRFLANSRTLSNAVRQFISALYWYHFAVMCWLFTYTCCRPLIFFTILFWSLFSLIRHCFVWHNDNNNTIKILCKRGPQNEMPKQREWKRFCGQCAPLRNTEPNNYRNFFSAIYFIKIDVPVFRIDFVSSNK